jgi:hypothetical protein
MFIYTLNKLIEAFIILGDTMISCTAFLGIYESTAASSWHSSSVSNHG